MNQKLEKDVLALKVKGHGANEIARLLGYSVARVYQALDAINYRANGVTVPTKELKDMQKRIAELEKALEEICEIDAETNEALQSTCVAIALGALSTKRGPHK